MEYAADLASIQQAHERIKPHIHLTPVLTSAHADSLTGGRSLFLKAEHLQKCGAFKARGALNAVLRLLEEAPPGAALSVCTHSSGNHGAAVAYAAALSGLAATVVVPRGTPGVKQAAVAGYGGRVIVCDPTIDAREAAAAAVQAETGAAFIPPYNHPDVIAGQGTVGLELLAQVPDLDAIIVPVSGGGLLSGTAIAAKALRPGIVILAAEPTGRNDAADVAASLAAGELVALPKPETMCDGLEARLGSLTWPAVRDHVDGVVTVREEEVAAATRLLFERAKAVVEPSGAAALAAALSPRFLGDPRYARCARVGVVLSGGNLDLAALGLWDALARPRA